MFCPLVSVIVCRSLRLSISFQLPSQVPCNSLSTALQLLCNCLVAKMWSYYAPLQTPLPGIMFPLAHPVLKKCFTLTKCQWSGVAMLRLKGVVQHYGWGRLGEESTVAQLHSLSSKTEIDKSKPYAELWMGSHPSAPSLVIEDENSPETGTPLNEWIQKNPTALGPTVLKKWQRELPFLLKVLSVAKASSIQAHPDKRLAELLFQTLPDTYNDPNHKPEMTLALTEFQVLCGFIGSEELKQTLNSTPELRRVLQERDVTMLLTVNPSETPSQEERAALKRAFTTVVNLGKETVAESVRALTARLIRERNLRELSAREELLLVLEQQYPDDVGVLASVFLNHIVLKPGQAVYLAANVPHASISGESVECMATSDNVVRAGLTPKFRDTATLTSMLTYEQGLPDLLEGRPVSPFTRRFSPPFDEFEVDLITVPAGDSFDFEAISGPSIFFVSEGKGEVIHSEGSQISMLQKGDIFFVPAAKGFRLSAKGEIDISRQAIVTEIGSGAGKGNGSADLSSSSFRPVGSTFFQGNSTRLYRAGVNSSFLLS